MTELLDNRYRLIELLGEGAMGEVYLVEDTLTRQTVALKVIKRDAQDRSSLQLQQEFRLQTKLRHPNCCEVYSYGTLADGAPYFTMEVVRGKDLDELLPLDLEQFRRVFAQLLLALGYVHQQGFIYRDLKPTNVRVRPDGVLKLMDFGLMELAGQAGEAIAGTVPYLSPEMIRRAKLDQRSDLYSLGALAYELLTGQVPFIRPTPVETLRAHLTEMPVPPTTMTPKLDARTENVVLTLLAKDPLERFQSAEEVLMAMGHTAARSIGGMLLSSPLLGREAELATLDAKLARLSAQQPGEALLLWGPEGTGKSRLLEELRFSCELAGVPYAMGKAYESGNFPYRHFVWVLRGLLPALQSQVPELLSRLAPVLVKLLPELGVPAAADMEPSQEKLRLQSAVTEALLGLSQKRGFAVVLENWQWAEPLSIELLEHLLRNLSDASILLVVASRLPHDQGNTELASMARLPLGALEPEATKQMVRAMLGSPQVDARFLELALQHTEGNPQRVERLLERLVKDGQLAKKVVGWQTPQSLKPSTEQPFDFDALSAAATTVARAGSVAGPAFELAVLRHVAGLPDEALFDALTELVAAQVLVPGDAGSYGFAQENLRQRFYTQVGPEDRNRLHVAALEALEARLEGTPAEAPLEQVVALARHALIAGATGAAVTYTLEAGTRSARLFATADAEELLSAGLRQVQTGGGDRWRPEKLRFLHALGDLRRVAGNLEGARTAYMDAAMLARELDERASIGKLLTSLAKVYQALGQLPEAIDTCEQALEACLAAGDRGEAARSLLTSARIHYFQGRGEQALGAAERALHLAREAGDRAHLGSALGFLGYLYVSAGPERGLAGIQALHEAIALHQEVGDKMGLLLTLDYLGNAQLMRGDWPQARESFLLKQSLCAEIGYHEEEAIALVNLALIAFELGDMAECRRLAAVAGELSVHLAAKMPLSYARLLEGVASTFMGQAHRGVKLALEGLTLAEGLGNRYLVADMLPYVIQMRVHLGHAQEARQLLEQFRTLVPEGEMNGPRILLAALEGELDCLEGDAEAGQTRLRSALGIAKATEAKGLQVRAYWALARAGARAQAWPEARRLAEQGLTLARSLQAGWWLAELKGLLGEIALATSEGDARAHFEAMRARAVASSAPLLEALALFGLAASESYGLEAVSLVEQARKLLATVLADLDPADRERYLSWPERQRVWTGNHIDFGLARIHKRGTGSLPPPGMWRG